MGPSKRKNGVAVALAAFACYVLVMAFGRIADRFLLWPQTGHEDARGASRHVIRSNGSAIEVWRASSDGAQESTSDAFILRFYGNADRADRWVSDEAKRFGQRSVEIWGVNYPGYGGSTGPASLEGVARSALAVFQHLESHAKGRPIYVYGTSLGTTAALAVASRHGIAGLRLQNPVPLREIIRGEHGWWNLWLLAYPVSLQVPEALDSTANARRCTAPAVFILSERDEIVPLKYQRLVADNYAGRKKTIVVRGAMHNDPIPEAARRDVSIAMQELWGFTD